ncbi:MAG TPA: MEDS domain-containing protein [Candidatus Bathyarchaeia archaeon]|nr:MEDS domain-containing protein [Candidatus Bathyarchaeia archaeon]
MAAVPKFGLDFVGDIPWGTHLCQFYETKQDLVEILVPYFAEGLRGNEACMWVTSEPLEVKEAAAALAKAVPNLDGFFKNNQLLILPYTEWYLKGKTFDADRVLNGWVKKEKEARARGFRGLRLTGNTFWIERSLWDSFADYEEAVNRVIGEHRIIALCTYALGKCSGSDVIDVERNHVGTIIKQSGKWMVVGDMICRRQADKSLHEAAETVHALNEKLRTANEELWIANEELELRVNERSVELAATNEELKTANEELKSTNDELRSEVEQRSQAEESARVHARHAETLSRVISAGNHAASFQTALAAMLDTALDLLPLNYGGIFLRDGDGTALQHSRGYTAEQRAWAEHIPLTQSLTGRVMAGKPLFLDDYQAVISPEVREINKNVGSMALIPLVAGHKVLGFYSLGTRGTRYTFTDEDRALLLSIGQEAGTVIAKLQAEEELQRYSSHLKAIVEERTAQLKDAERLAGIGETAAMIGHDLRNPLQGLQYIVDLQKLRFERMPDAERNVEGWKREAELFDRISEQVFYMDKIVADLQDYARPLDPERETVSLRKLIRDVLDSLPHTDGAVEVVTDIPDLTIEAEPHLMHRVLSNLFLNALQAMPDGGTLTITASSADGAVAIAVSDTGVGIPEEMTDKLFSPLMTGKAKGTGLGLAVVKRIVNAHGGTIKFESEEGNGTTFTVTLPRRAVD